MSTTRVHRVVTGLIVIFGAVLVAAPALAAQGPVGLGTADSFAVLAGSGITNTGATTITGDVGTFPTPSETGFNTVTLVGTDHADDAVTQGAKDDLVTAYDDAFGRQPRTSVPVELGGTTLLPGVYASPTFGLTGTLTLDAQGDPAAQFIFQAESTLITATNSHVLLTNAASPCNVVWQVGSSATFNTGTQFVGNVLALTSISAKTSATFQGRLLARNGAVTLDTNTITNAACAAPAGTGGTTTTTTGGTTTTTALTSNPAATAGTPAVGLGSPTGTPGGPGGAGGTPGTGSSPPSLPVTGAHAFRLAGAGLALLALGALALHSARRRTELS